MAMPRHKRRTITVDGVRYHWVAPWERSGHVIIQRAASGDGSIIIEPLEVMMPKHVAGAIRFALSEGWGKSKGAMTCWLGFEVIDDRIHFRKIAPNSEIYYDQQAGQWKLPPAMNS